MEPTGPVSPLGHPENTTDSRLDHPSFIFQRYFFVRYLLGIGCSRPSDLRLWFLAHTVPTANPVPFKKRATHILNLLRTKVLGL